MNQDTKPNFSKRIYKKIVTPLERFMALEASSGIVLILAAVSAMFLANSPWREAYEHILHTPVSFSFGDWQVTHGLAHWINDGLMVIFFFVVGLEIKRELVIGELSNPRRAALPMIAALGGMVVPAAIYAFFNRGGIGHAGWGIPMATDIAFAVGVLTLFGRKVPVSLKIFLLALAIVDDLGAVLVIALFYTEQIAANALAWAAATFFVVLFLRQAGVRTFWPYWICGVIAWYNVLNSGVHATVAGVILGLMTPVHALDGEQQSPLDALVAQLHSVVAFVIMPVFALANAGVNLSASSPAHGPLFSNPITWGVVLGLLIGKPVGVIAFSWLAVRLKWAVLPNGIRWPHITAAGFLAGIGFTMALFISHLALKSPELEYYSKSGILLSSIIAASFGGAVLYFVTRTGSSQSVK